MIEAENLCSDYHFRKSEQFSDEAENSPRTFPFPKTIAQSPLRKRFPVQYEEIRKKLVFYSRFRGVLDAGRRADLQWQIRRLPELCLPVDTRTEFFRLLASSLTGLSFRCRFDQLLARFQRETSTTASVHLSAACDRGYAGVR